MILFSRYFYKLNKEQKKKNYIFDKIKIKLSLF